MISENRIANFSKKAVQQVIVGIQDCSFSPDRIVIYIMKQCSQLVMYRFHPNRPKNNIGEYYQTKN